jgi:hypothetical protein
LSDFSFSLIFFTPIIFLIGLFLFLFLNKKRNLISSVFVLYLSIVFIINYYVGVLELSFLFILPLLIIYVFLIFKNKNSILYSFLFTFLLICICFILNLILNKFSFFVV